MEDKIMDVLAKGLLLLGERYLEQHGCRAEGLKVVRVDKAEEDAG